MPPGLDRQLVMCTHTFFNCSWVNDTASVKTGAAPDDYTTSVLGNASLTWINQVLESGKDHPPFYAWIGPHAPHLPSTPAPWYADHPIGLLKPPRDDVDPRYSWLGLYFHGASRLHAATPRRVMFFFFSLIFFFLLSSFSVFFPFLFLFLGPRLPHADGCAPIRCYA